MAFFEKDNGEVGKNYVCHTSTGYEGLAGHPANTHGKERSVVFFARHTIGENGRPYTELGLNGLSNLEQKQAIKKMKQSLEKSGYQEIENKKEKITNNKFFEHKSTNSCGDLLCVRVVSDDIAGVIQGIDGALVNNELKEFVKTQEEVPDVLFHSIMEEMGEELERGPGGHNAAVKKAKELANYFTNGIS